MNFILDTNILLSLNRDIRQSRIGVTYNILYTINNEISQDRIKNSFTYKIIKDFMRLNSISPIGYLNEEIGDDSIISELKTINHKKYYFVTNDKILQNRVKELGFNVLNRHEFIKLIKTKEIIKRPIFVIIKNYYKSILIGLFVPILFMLLLVISVYLFYLYPLIIMEKWFQYAMIIIIPIISYLIYLFRLKKIIFYGISETLIGIITVVTAINTSENTSNISDILKMFAGFYIIIRGLDNVEKGIISPVIMIRWNKIFFYTKK